MARSAMVVWCVTAVVIAAGLVLNAVNLGTNAGLSAPVGHDIVFSLWAAAYATVGALITVRRPGNVVGWLLLAAGFVFAQGSLSFEYANFALGPGFRAGRHAGALAADSVSTAALSSDLPGTPAVSRRAAAEPALASGGVVLAGVGCAPALSGMGWPRAAWTPALAADNPIGIGSRRGAELLGFVVLGWTLTVVGFAAAGIATVGGCAARAERSASR